MDKIEDIWDKGNSQISDDKTVNKDFILKSISESSSSINSKLPKVIWFGIISSLIGAIVLIYNIFFYLNNTPILISISVLLTVNLLSIIYLVIQLGIIKNMDMKALDLKGLLMFKLKYLNTRFQFALHCVALAIVIVTFTINLTMENSDGIFEIRKILILSVFYLFIYFISIYLYKVMHSVYIKQLNNALFNLEENALRSFEKELNKHKRIRKTVGIIFLIVLLTGVVFLLLNSMK